MRLKEARKLEAQRAIINAGLRLFAEQGFGATTVDQITSAAGVAKGTFYYYFKTKEDLALAGLVPVLEAAEAELTGGPMGSEPISRQLGALFTRFDQWIRANPELVWVWTVENLRRGKDEPGAAIFHRMLTHLVATAQERGEIRADRTAESIAIDLEGITLAQIASWRFQQPSGNLADVLGAAFDTYLTGAYSSKGEKDRHEQT